MQLYTAISYLLATSPASSVVVYSHILLAGYQSSLQCSCIQPYLTCWLLVQPLVQLYTAISYLLATSPASSVVVYSHILLAGYQSSLQCSCIQPYLTCWLLVQPLVQLYTAISYLLATSPASSVVVYSHILLAGYQSSLQCSCIQPYLTCWLLVQPLVQLYTAISYLLATSLASSVVVYSHILLAGYQSSLQCSCIQPYLTCWLLVQPLVQLYTAISYLLATSPASSVVVYSHILLAGYQSSLQCSCIQPYLTCWLLVQPLVQLYTAISYLLATSPASSVVVYSHILLAGYQSSLQCSCIQPYRTCWLLVQPLVQLYTAISYLLATSLASSVVVYSHILLAGYQSSLQCSCIQPYLTCWLLVQPLVQLYTAISYLLATSLASSVVVYSHILLAGYQSSLQCSCIQPYLTCWLLVQPLVQLYTAISYLLATSLASSVVVYSHILLAGYQSSLQCSCIQPYLTCWLLVQPLVQLYTTISYLLATSLASSVVVYSHILLAGYQSSLQQLYTAISYLLATSPASSVVVYSHILLAGYQSSLQCSCIQPYLTCWLLVQPLVQLYTAISYLLATSPASSVVVYSHILLAGYQSSLQCSCIQPYLTCWLLVQPLVQLYTAISYLLATSPASSVVVYSHILLAGYQSSLQCSCIQPYLTCWLLVQPLVQLYTAISYLLATSLASSVVVYSHILLAGYQSSLQCSCIQPYLTCWLLVQPLVQLYTAISYLLATSLASSSCLNGRLPQNRFSASSLSTTLETQTLSSPLKLRPPNTAQKDFRVGVCMCVCACVRACACVHITILTTQEKLGFLIYSNRLRPGVDSARPPIITLYLP